MAYITNCDGWISLMYPLLPVMKMIVQTEMFIIMITISNKVLFNAPLLQIEGICLTDEPLGQQSYFMTFSQKL